MYIHAESSEYDDAAEEVLYFPEGAWLQNSGPQYYNGTYHYSRALGAYVTFTFDGSFVAYLSDLNNDHGDFLVSVDGRPAERGSSYSPQAVSRATVLFSAFLDPGVHTLRIENAARAAIVGVDYFITSSVRPDNTSAALRSTATGSSTAAPQTAIAPSEGTSFTTAPHPNAGQGIPRGAFYATIGVLCCLLAVLAAAASVMVARRRSRVPPMDSRSTPPANGSHLGNAPPPYSGGDTFLSGPSPSTSSDAKSRAGRPQARFPPPDAAMFDTAVSVML